MDITEMLIEGEKKEKEILKRFKKWSWKKWNWDFVTIETDEEEKVLDKYALTGWVEYSKNLYDLLVNNQVKVRLSKTGRWLVEALGK